MAQVTRQKRGFFGWTFLIVFYGFNALMLLWLFSYLGEVGGKLSQGSDAQQAGAALGTTIGVGIIFFIWALGAVITGLLAMMTRGRQVMVEDVKARCPFCAEPIQPTAKICPHCRSNLVGPTAGLPQQ